MEKLYRALVWLAGVAIVLGLAFAAVFTAQAASYYSQVPHVSYTDELYSGLVIGLYTGDLPTTIKTAAFLAVCGATLLALTLAWADRRFGWLLALLIVTLLALLWPTWVEAWTLHTLQLSQPVPVTASLEAQIFSGYAAPLAPAAMALILALARRKPAPSTTPGASVLGAPRTSP